MHLFVVISRRPGARMSLDGPPGLMTHGCKASRSGAAADGPHLARTAFAAACFFGHARTITLNRLMAKMTAFSPPTSAKKPRTESHGRGRGCLQRGFGGHPSA